MKNEHCVEHQIKRQAEMGDLDLGIHEYLSAAGLPRGCLGKGGVGAGDWPSQAVAGGLRARKP
jgi:hypothetical protein